MGDRGMGDSVAVNAGGYGRRSNDGGSRVVGDRGNDGGVRVSAGGNGRWGYNGSGSSVVNNRGGDRSRQKSSTVDDSHKGSKSGELQHGCLLIDAENNSATRWVWIPTFLYDWRSHKRCIIATDRLIRHWELLFGTVEKHEIHIHFFDFHGLQWRWPSPAQYKSVVLAVLALRTKARVNQALSSYVSSISRLLHSCVLGLKRKVALTKKQQDNIRNNRK